MKQAKKHTVLVVDDDPFVRESVSALLDEYDYSTVTCKNAKEAINRFQGNTIDIVLTDIKMPGMSGIDLLGKIHALDPDVPVILITAYSDLDLAMGAIKSGAFDYIPKPYKPEHLLHTINKAVKHNRLIQMEKNYKLILETSVRKKTQEIVQLSREVIKRLVTVAEFRDTDTGAHISRIGLYANKIAEYMNKPIDFIDAITYASPLHDIGKIGIPDSVLLKPGPLTAGEFTVMKTHSAVGEKMLSGSSHPVIQMGAIIALNHHERWDGSGYPAGLKGSDI
ncbi:MAG TPA: response regulator, partial [Nitrospirae bacterium]|nr:response regulator [Nitrospirota bacterium]